MCLRVSWHAHLYHLFCRITNALDLKEHLQKTVKKLPAGIKRKVRLSERVRACSPAPGTVPAACLTATPSPCLSSPPAVLRPEHAGEPPGHAAGRAVHRHGSQSQAAHVVSVRWGRARPRAGPPSLGSCQVRIHTQSPARKENCDYVFLEIPLNLIIFFMKC